MTRGGATLRLSGSGAELESASRALVECLAGLHDLLKRLLETAGEKLPALRRADAGTLHECTTREAALLEQVQQHRRRRNAILARLAQSLQWPGAKSARLSKIAEGIPEPFSAAVRARIAGLRDIATALEEKNRLAALVARDLQNHVRGMFADIAKATQESVVYGPEGNHEQTTTRSWVDAVG